MNDPTPMGRGLGRALSIFGAAVISWSLIAQYLHGTAPLWAVALAILANVAWVLLVLLPTPVRSVSVVCMAIMVAGGALTAAANNGSALVPAAVAVLWLTRDIRLPSWFGLVLGVCAAALVIVGDVLSPTALLGVVALEAGVLVGFLAGLSRRQFLLADLRARELVAEHARTDVLAARAQLAGEIHDVLAHSLGGLVLQLDAVDALLESGNGAAAAAKVAEARALAAEGLGEARRAVAALSEPPADSSEKVAADQVVATIAALVTAHDSLGGMAELRERGPRQVVSAPVELALRRAVQEGLTNARKHAPGQRVTVTLAWSDGTVEVRIANRVDGMVPRSPDGHGLLGMRTRFAALPGGQATAGVSGHTFLVTVRASTA